MRVILVGMNMFIMYMLKLYRNIKVNKYSYLLYKIFRNIVVFLNLFRVKFLKLKVIFCIEKVSLKFIF